MQSNLTEVRRFRLEVPQGEIDELRRRINATRWPTRELVTDRSQGVQLAAIQNLARYWTTEYDWRKCEARLNALLAISRFSPSSEPPPWLAEVYERRRHRTVHVVELSIAALTCAGQRASLAAIARVSRTVHPEEPDRNSASAILHKEEAYSLYRQHAESKRNPVRKPSLTGRQIGKDA